MSSRYAPFRRQPHLDVVLLRRGGAEIAGGDVHDAVRQAEPADDLLLDREDALVLVPRLARARTYENISTLSNWCTRKMPRVSLPYVPASRRKYDENPA